MKKQVFVVTGSGNGIGREVVLHLLNKGHKVAAIDISAKGLEETKGLTNHQENIITYTADITDLSRVEAVHNQIMNDFNMIDGLIHVAGIIQPFVKVVDLDYDVIKKVMDVNFYGTLYLNKTFIPSLLRDEDTYLVNVCSMGGFLPVPGQAIYGASKAAVKLLTEALYAELKDTKLNLTAVFPGGVRTNITKNSNADLTVDKDTTESSYKMLEPDKAAELIVKAMYKKKLYSYIGSDSKTMKKIYTLAPKKAINLIAKNMAGILK